MKLLFVAPSAYLLGGVQDWLATLVPDLRARGVDVTVAVPDGDRHQLGPYCATYPQLAALPFRNPTGSPAGRGAALVRLLQEHPADLVVGVNLVDLYGAVRQLRRTASPRTRFAGRVIMTLHAIEADYLADLAREASVIDAVVATNRLTCALAGQLTSLPGERILYAPYGVTVPALAGTRASTDSCLRLAWVGRLEESQKRVHDIPPILRELDALDCPYRLSVAGEGPEHDSLRRELAPWLASGRVRMLGRLSREQLREQVYGTHQVLLITSRWETGPIVAWEAMAAGLAVVSSRYVGSGLEGALEGERTALLYPVGEERAAARQIGRLQDPALRQQLGAAGQALVRERYGTEASLLAWLRAFEHVLALPPLPLPPASAATDPAGRLDQWLGPARAERLRRRLGLRFVHDTAGGEWPHTAHHDPQNELLLEQATALDAHA
jgi:glycosyltransferase involved in cell wall biosynthesis